MKNILLITILLFSFQMNGQMAFVPSDYEMTDTTQVTELESPDLIVTESSGLIAPTLWKYADGMEGYDMYAVYKSMRDRKLYLIGFDSEGNQNFKMLIEVATFNSKLNQCTVIQNGTEIRLRQRQP